MSCEITIKKALNWAFSLLETQSDSASIDAEVLLQFSLNKNRTFLYTWPDKVLSNEVWLQFKHFIDLRLKGKPVAHITGTREFWSLEFQVNDTTLIPRPDTELLIETALELPLADDANVLDLGTGTGAIALSLASEKNHWRIIAVDKIESAVDLAIQNRNRLQLEQVAIMQSDWFDSVSKNTFDLIVSNPPYIDETDIHLTQGDVQFEPLTALIASNEGFADLFYIAEVARQHLTKSGYLLMEHGYQQGTKLRQKMQELGYQGVETKIDLGGNERCTIGCWQQT